MPSRRRTAFKLVQTVLIVQVRMALGVPSACAAASWSPTGSLHFARSNFRTVRLLDGRVLAISGAISDTETPPSITLVFNWTRAGPVSRDPARRDA